jgi:hypothetical protein
MLLGKPVSFFQAFFPQKPLLWVPSVGVEVLAPDEVVDFGR